MRDKETSETLVKPDAKEERAEKKNYGNGNMRSHGKHKQKSEEKPNAGIQRRERTAFNLAEAKIDEKHAVERPAAIA